MAKDVGLSLSKALFTFLKYIVHTYVYMNSDKIKIFLQCINLSKVIYNVNKFVCPI